METSKNCNYSYGPMIFKKEKIPMMTKKQACLAAIERFATAEGVKVVTENDILKSSTLAVALEYLGRITNPELQEYAKSRNGSVWLYWDTETKQPVSLGFREILNLLPE